MDYLVEHGYHGAENLSYIPGEMGAAAVQNIGLLPRKIDGADKAHVAFFALQIELQGKGVLYRWNN